MGKPRTTRKPEPASLPAAPPLVEPAPPAAPAAPKAHISSGAEMVGLPRITGSVAIKAAAAKKFGEVEDLHLGLLLEKQVRQLKAGDMAPVEEMLYLQARSLDVLYTHLLHRGMGCEQIPGLQANLALALKAQAQCRSTLQALADIKNPRAVAFVRQANIAQQQQVNNGGPAPRACARAEEPEPASNELLEDGTHEQQQRMVPRAQAAPARGDSAVEAVGAVNGAADSRRQGNVGAQ